jgi:ABC-type multidrug transport system fused ATPase/permease subunit
MPNYAIALVLIGVAVASSVAGLLLVRRFVPAAVLQQQHDVASPKFQVIGTLYAVLLAFVVVVVWQQFQSASVNVDVEATKLSDLYRDAEEYPEAERVRLRRQLRAYAEAVVTDEWDAMARGGESTRAWVEYDGLWKLYRALRPRDLTEIPIATETLRRMSELGEARSLRLLHSRAAIHPVLWAGLIVLGVITIGFGYFFGARLRAQVAMTALFASAIGILVFIIVVLAHPFRGYGRISP